MNATTGQQTKPPADGNAMIPPFAQETIEIDGRCFIRADEMPAAIRELAARYRVDFRFVNRRVFLDAEQMRSALRHDTGRLEAENITSRQKLTDWQRQHPFRAVGLWIWGGVAWLFGLDW